jgi:hypothetical protein
MRGLNASYADMWVTKCQRPFKLQVTFVASPVPTILDRVASVNLCNRYDLIMCLSAATSFLTCQLCEP